MLHGQQGHPAISLWTSLLNLGDLFIDFAASMYRCVFRKMVVPEQPRQHQRLEGDAILRLAALRTVHRIIERALGGAEQQHMLAKRRVLAACAILKNAPA